VFSELVGGGLDRFKNPIGLVMDLSELLECRHVHAGVVPTEQELSTAV